MSIVERGVIGVPTDVPMVSDVGLRRPSGREPLRDDEPRAGVTDGEGGGKDCNITLYWGNTSPQL